MIRSEINNFTMSYARCGSFSCSAPCTLFSILREKGIFKFPNNEAEAEGWRGYFDSSCDFDSGFELNDSNVKRKYIYLRFYGVYGVADIYLNEKKIATLDNSQRVWTIDIKGICRVGKNQLKIRFLPGTNTGKVLHQLDSEYGLSIHDCGLSGKVELLKFNNAIIDNISVAQTLDGDSATVHIRLETIGNADSVKAVATLISGSGQVHYGGFTNGQGSIQIRNPLYWWPRGLGVQNIYRLTVNLYGDHDIEDTRDFRIGISKVGLNCEEGALCQANGVGFMPMGVYYTPADDVMSSISREKINALIMSIAKANCNTLIVSGSGGFASEQLLDACDTHGIVVWQELPYGAHITLDDAEGYKMAVVSSLKKLSHHPSFAVIVDTIGDARFGDLEILCKNAAPKLSFMKDEAYSKIMIGAYPALPVDETLAVLDGEGANLYSENMEWHCGDNADIMLLSNTKDYLYASSLSDFSYISRLVQADRLTDYARSERVKRSLGGAAIISRLTDSRPTVSDSMVDYFCRPKAVEFYAERFFNPIYLIPKRDGGRVGFAISNEKRQSFEGFVYYKILDAQNNIVYHGSDDVKVPEMSTLAFEGRDFTDVVSGHENEYYLEYGLREGALTVSRGTLLFVKPKRFKFCDPKIKSQISGTGRMMSITLRAEAFAKDVEISFPGHDVLLKDNYFDITSSAPVKVDFVLLSGSVNSFDLEEALRIKCVNNISNVNKSVKKSLFDAKKEELLEKLNIDLI